MTPQIKNRKAATAHRHQLILRCISSCENIRDYEKLLGEIAADAAPAFIMPTYTAMFDLRGEISKHTDVKAFYE